MRGAIRARGLLARILCAAAFAVQMFVPTLHVVHAGVPVACARTASLPEIGRALGRAHPAVRNAVDMVERAVLERAPLRYQVEEIATRLDQRSRERGR